MPGISGQKDPLSFLVIDDNAVVRAALGEMLEQEGWRVTYCKNGRSAVERSFEDPFDAILVDFKMPGMNGTDVVTILRPAYPYACIIGMSLEDRSNEFLAAGADAFLTKPYDIHELFSILNVHGSSGEAAGS